MTSGPAVTPTALVVGGGVSGLLSAWELIRAGYEITLVEAGGSLGGCVAPRTVALPGGREITLDAGAESFAVRTPAVRELVAELGLGEAVVEPHPGGSWLYLPPSGPGQEHRAVPAPRLGILGIPGDLDAPEVAEALGADALERARQDLEDSTVSSADATSVTHPTPVPPSLNTWREAVEEGTPVTVGAVVRDRMGEGVLQTLVAPVVAGVHSADPDTLDLRTVAPGLLEALVAEGSLARAVASRRAAAPPGAVVASLRGGMHTLTAALAEEVCRAGARVLTGTRAVTLARAAAEHRWTVELTAGVGGTETVTVDRVVVATDGPRAWDLLAPVSGGALSAADRPQEGAGVALVTLVVDAPGLDANPRGTGLLVSPAVSSDVVGAKALTHVSAKWDWARQELGGHRHVVRLSYGRVTDAPDSAAPGYRTPEEDLRARAVADAMALTGVDVAAGLVSSFVVRWKSALPAATTDHRTRVESVRTWLGDQPGLDAVGAWLAGTGLAAIVADTRRRIVP
ncbi:NAD(P)/FAD-dependent oxidoreductase [Citricoccus sp. K5]|uniref:protoporphyrinogen/coproporphyrinogen oxidase n=1 Tax=Citricoccus sp. K5 TaxID=2653135 RepID=UPI0012F09C2E|nr:FAD-dependent oxidoreductase [Citricoccus sp. K5]VXB54252.1 Oxygen-dependent protoporphyrinogen oxidase [Citricoccus sp. K5]